MEQPSPSRRVGIIGTGSYAQALAKRCFYAGYDVIIGSRRPHERDLTEMDECLCDVTLTSVAECIKRTSIIFVAVHVENYKDCLSWHVDMLQDKILVDLSNRKLPSKTDSNAEYLQKLAPKSTVVKAFNVISTYSMDNENTGGSKQVFIASDDVTARVKISNIASDIGFRPVDLGCLKSARRIEGFPLRLFPDWKSPVLFTIGVFNIWLLYIIYIYFVKTTAYRWDQLFVKVVNKPLCMTSITVLACTFLPSSVAGIFQFYHGTKHIRFPKWLDKWLRTRKQLGVIGFLLLCVHVIMSLLIMSPTYFRTWYQTTVLEIPHNLTEPLILPMKTWMIWKGEAACFSGIVAFMIICIMAISTIPSVSDNLNWREWRFVQSKLGHVALFFAIGHVLIMGAPGWATGGAVKTVQSITFLSVLLPIFTILLKCVLCLPCIDKYITKIRHGWERRAGSKCRGRCATVPNKTSSVGYVAVQDKDCCRCTEELTMITVAEDSNCNSEKEI
jgi:predicted dinucleotide-binding enzyme/DMSO/TMAO reductase YedYZ heme-binding membrane subunit